MGVLSKLAFWKKKTDQNGGSQNNSINDMDMRDVILSLVAKSNVNFGNVYLKPTQSELDAKPDLETWDGLIMRPEGYFRVAKEPDTGIKVLLFEFEPKHLTGVRTEDGTVKLSNLDQASAVDDPDVYRVGAFDPTADNSTIQDAINDFCRDLRNNIIPDMDVYLRDENQRECKKTPIKNHKFRVANKDVAFGLYKEEGADEWQSVLYSTLRGSHDTSGQFERISDGKDRKKFRLNSEEMKSAEDFGGVLKHTLQYWGISSLKKFKGQNPLSEAMTLGMIRRKKGMNGKLEYSRIYARQQFRKGVRFTTGFVGTRYKEYGMSALVSLALSVKNIQLGAIRIVAWGIAAGVGATFIGKFIDEQTQKGVKTFFGSKAKYREMQKILPKDRDYSRFFDAITPQNTARPLKKIAPSLVGRMELLCHKESGVMHSMDDTSGVKRKKWKEQYLGGLETRMFGKANMALCGDSVLKILPNGVIALTHISQEFNTVSKYYSYNEAFVSSKSAPLHPYIKEMLSGGVYKVTDDRSKAGLDGKLMRRSDFTKEIRKVFADVTDIQGETTDVPNILAKLFNPKANNNPHNRIGELLSEAARVNLGEVEDPLTRIMELSKDLRDERKAKLDEGKKAKKEKTPRVIPNPPQIAYPSISLIR